MVGDAGVEVEGVGGTVRRAKSSGLLVYATGVRSLALFNHKGGVGKTTLLFNIGLALAQSGRRVLFIDADAQANLTAAALAPLMVERSYTDKAAISDILRPLVEGSGDIGTCVPVQIRETAWIIPGHIQLSDYEEICPAGWTEALAGNARGLRVTTAPFRIALAASRTIGAEYVIFDLGPNVGAMNRNILLSCDGFVVPLAPDLFSLNALSSVGRRIELWVAEWGAIMEAVGRRKLELDFPLPTGRPSPLGYVSQQFSIYRQAPAEAYSRWLDQIPEAYRIEVAQRLSLAKLAVPKGQDRIGEVRNLSSLVPIAQRSNAAVFELGGSEARGAQFTRAKDTYKTFNEIASEIVMRLDSVSPGTE